ncbi:hypothetical protein M0R45_031200 [Rubus argutus]|uniref:Uncharacterized protein n=1 Tax=Rubus argutus TaxID=59490 RepID=A0AAW1WGJ5_RUBAR
MLNPKKLIRITRKLQNIRVIGRKKGSYLGAGVVTCYKTNSPMCADKGSFVIYTLDKRRFVFPLSYLSNYIFQELFKMSEEEFGISSHKPITFPCDSLLMNYIVSLAQLGMSLDLEKDVVNSIIRTSCSLSTSHQEQTSQQLLLCGY